MDAFYKKPKMYILTLALLIFSSKNCFADLLAVRYSNKIDIIDTSNGKTIKTLLEAPREFIGHFTQMSWSPSGRFFAIANFQIVHIWDTSTWQEIKTFDFTDRNSRVSSLTWSPDETMLALALITNRQGIEREEIIEIIDVKSWGTLNVLAPKTTYPLMLAWSPNGKMLAARGLFEKNTPRRNVFETTKMLIKIWDTSSWQIIKTLPFSTIYPVIHESLKSIEWSPDGTMLAATANQTVSALRPPIFAPNVTVWDTLNWHVMVTKETGERTPPLFLTVAWNHNGTMLAWNVGSRILIFDPSTWKEIQTLRIKTRFREEKIDSVAFKPESRISLEEQEERFAFMQQFMPRLFTTKQKGKIGKVTVSGVEAPASLLVPEVNQIKPPQIPSKAGRQRLPRTRRSRPLRPPARQEIVGTVLRETLEGDFVVRVQGREFKCWAPQRIKDLIRVTSQVRIVPPRTRWGKYKIVEIRRQ